MFFYMHELTAHTLSLKIWGFKLSVFFQILIRQPNPLKLSINYIYNQIALFVPKSAPIHL